MPSQIQEALTALGATALVPKVIDRVLTEYQRRYAPVIASIPSFKWDTDVFYFNRREANPSGGFVADGGARQMANSTYNQYGFTMKHLQIIGGVTGYAQAVTSGQIGDLLGKEVDGGLKGHYWDMEAAALWGNAAATANGPYPQFDGFDSLISTFSGTGQNAIDWNNAAFSLGALDQLADMVETNSAMSVFNSSWMYLVSNTAMSKLSQLLVNNQRFVSQVEVAAGLIVPTYRDIPLVKSSFLSTRSFSVGSVTSATATTGGTLPDSTTYRYQVGAVVYRQGEIVPSTEVTQATGSSANTNTITLSFTPPTVLDSATPMLYKVYRTAAGGSTGTETLLGYVDAVVGVASDGVTPVLTTSIQDTGTALIPKNGSTVPGTLPTAYYGTNTSKKPVSGAAIENIFLVPRDEEILCRPYVRQAERLPVATTVSAPDTLPFVLQTDTVVALRSPKFVGGLYRADTHLS